MTADLFGLDNLPYASVVDTGGRRFAAVRLGDGVFDLATVEPNLFAAGTLDRFLAAGRAVWTEIRARVVERLRRPDTAVLPFADVTPVLGFAVADYVDFYASEHHASAAGRLFRPGSAGLPANWKHLPVGYHGRAGTVVASGTPIRRPVGQTLGTDGAVRFGPTARLDFEAEVGFVVGAGSTMGEPVPLEAFAEHVFGVCLVNDWSARDIQAWEYVPLGPFLGKSFATSMSAWITPLDALAAAWTTPPPRDPAPLPYLDDSARPCGLDIDVEIRLNGEVISRPPFASMYWTAPQLLAHLTGNGANLRTGDLLASGTISGPGRDERGCLLELTQGGAAPLRLADGTARGYLDDSDEIVITATATGMAGRIALGEVRGRVAPRSAPNHSVWGQNG